MEALLTNPWFYAVVTVGVAGGRWFLQHLVKNAVDHQFALRIESYKSELQRVAEQERFALQRKLAASGLYLEKQHNAAADIYRAVRVAHGAVSSLFGFQRSLNLDDCNEQDLREILKTYGVLEGKTEDLIHTWKRDRKAGNDAIVRHIGELRLPQAENKLQEARNLMYLNEIYFSDATIVAFDAFVAQCNEWIMRATFPPERGQHVKMVSREELHAALEGVQSTLRSELSDPPTPSTVLAKSDPSRPAV